MSRKRCVRRVWALFNPIQYAIEGASISSRKSLDSLLTRELQAVDAFTHGRAGLNDWEDIVAMNNLAETLANQGIGPEALPHVRIAETALVEAAARFEKIGRMGLSGPGIQAIREVVEYHDLQRASIPRSQYEEAIRLTLAHVKNGHRTIDINKLHNA